MASSYKCKNVEKTWQHNATSRHEKCTLEGAIKEFQIFKSNFGKLRANQMYLWHILNRMFFFCLCISWAFCQKKLIRNPKLPSLPPLNWKMYVSIDVGKWKSAVKPFWICILWQEKFCSFEIPIPYIIFILENY